MKLIPLLLLVGILAVSGWAEDKKPEPYLVELAKKAEAGDAKAQCNLGGHYFFGEGVTQDYKEAVKWVTKSAEQGNAGAQRYLGCIYLEGEGVTRDYKEAVKWLTKSAEQGDALAQRYLGSCYKNGQGVGKDEKEAVKWYTKAAEQRDAGAQLMLGACYALGNGVTQDYKEAVKWYTKAAEQGEAGAQCLLGVCYKNGQGAGKDEKEAVKWFTKLSSLTLKTKGSLDNYFIGLGSLETGNFAKAKQALLLAGNRYGPTAENIRSEHMRLINSNDPCGAFVLQILDKDGSIIGTGFFCDPNGWVLTAAHVVAGQEMISVRDRQMNTWQVEGLFPGEFSSDVVLMKTSAHPQDYAELADTDSDVSDLVIQVGHPFGVLQQIVSEGKVENLNGNGSAWVCSMSAMPGNSGSPVFNQEWELVGITSKGSYFINSKKDSDPACTWVVPLRELRKLFEAAKKVSCFSPLL